MEPKMIKDMGKLLDTIDGRRKFNQEAESGIYIGRTADGREVRVQNQQGQGMEIHFEQKTKPKWWEVILYDADGRREGVTYSPRE